MRALERTDLSMLYSVNKGTKPTYIAWDQLSAFSAGFLDFTCILDLSLLSTYLSVLFKYNKTAVIACMSRIIITSTRITRSFGPRFGPFSPGGTRGMGPSTGWPGPEEERALQNVVELRLKSLLMTWSRGPPCVPSRPWNCVRRRRSRVCSRPRSWRSQWL